MRLTKDTRSAFVRAVIADVPKVDYDEQIRKLLLDTAIGLLPEPVRKIWDDPELNSYLRTTYHYFAGVSVCIPRTTDIKESFPAEILNAIDDLENKSYKQYEKITELRTKLTTVVNGCSTLKQLKLALPELEKYMPADNQLTLSHTNRSLPVVANVMGDLIKAGWKYPKE